MMVRVLVLVTAIFVPAIVGCDQSAPPQRSVSQNVDLGFDMDCGRIDPLVLEDDVERFLKRQGFRVFNKVRAQREHGIRPLQKLWIEGLDEQRRRVLVMSSPFTPTGYNIFLYTAPPTRRASDLETTLLAFASGQLSCTTSQIRRHENGVAARSVHDGSVERLEGWFRQLEELERK